MTKLLQVIGVFAVGGLVMSACSSSGGGDQTGKGGTTGSAGHGGTTGSGGGSGSSGSSGSTGSGGTAGSATGTGGGGATGTGGSTAGAGGGGATGTGGSTAGAGGGASGAGGRGGSSSSCSGGTGGAAGSAGTTGSGGSGASGGGSGSGGTTGGGGSGGGASGTTGGAGTTGTGGSALGGSGGGAGTTGAGGSAGTTGAGGSGGAGGTPPMCTEFPSNATGATSFTVTSSEYTSCAAIPAVRTCDQKAFPMGTSPAIAWTAGPSGTMSYAVVFKDLSVLARYASTDPNYNKGFHYVMWDIPADKRGLPANMMGGHLSTDVPGARQWSNFNNYGWFGPCPNFDPTMPTTYTDSYAFIVYALPFTKATIPPAMAGISTVRLMDGVFKAAALATAEYRGTSNAASTGIPAGTLPPTAKPLCPTDGSPVRCDCLAGP